ncbi:MAG: substrate-binding domain-containing protein [Acutalibacteraceae bacterium]|nr:substrate-binding domain-containing protein [Acutalibacteraceae bacterium]
MKVFIYIEPEYRGSVWCTHTLKGLTNEAAKRHYEVCILEYDNIFSCDLDNVYKDEQRRILIVLTTHIITDRAFYEYFAKYGVSLLFVNHQSSFGAENYSNILVDYRAGMAQLVKYLAQCGKEKTALFAINPASSTDQIKKEYFLGIQKREYDIFYNKGSLDSCCEAFFGKNKYDSVICANDIAAYCLISFLKKKGVNVPKDIYVTSFGDSMLSQISFPSLTTVSVDHNRLGKETLHAYSYLYRRNEEIRTSIYVTPKLNIRQSTESRAFDNTKEINTFTAISDPMYCDKVAQKLLKLEKLLNSCDDTDIKILKMIIKGNTYQKIAEELFMSEKTVLYRVTCMRNILEVASKEELTKFVGKLIKTD